MASVLKFAERHASDDISPDVLLERARLIAAEVAARAAEIDSSSQLPDDLVAKLVDSGLIALLVPKVYGGHEFGLDVAAKVIRLFAASSPSVAWVLAFYIGHNWIHCQFPEAAQREIFANGPSPMSAGVLAPLFKLSRVDGGYRVTGRNAWNSGSPHADWIMSGGMVAEEGKPAVPLTFIVPRDEVVLEDTWDVVGMRATGSYDLILTDLFIPEHRTVSALALFSGDTPGAALHGPAYRRPLVLLTFAYCIPMIVGATRGVADEFIQVTAGRVGTNDKSKAALKPAAQMRAGRGAARATLAEVMCDDLVGSVRSDDACVRFDRDERLALKARGAMITDFCRETINDLVLGAGANAFRRQSKLQMIFRDINMVSVHAFFEPEAATENYGRVVLGLDYQGPV